MKNALACAVLVLTCSCASGGSPPGAATRTATTPGSRAAANRPLASPAPAAAGQPTFQVRAIQRLTTRVGFLSATTASGPLLAETTDAAATWRRLAVPATVTALRFIDQRVGWAAAYAGPNAETGLVLRTVDGGATWQQALAFTSGHPGDGPVRQLEATDADHAWILATGPPPCSASCPLLLRRTTDGGTTWTTLTPSGANVIRFASASRGWLAVSNTGPGAHAAHVSVTSDGGDTWADAFATASGSVVGLDAASTSTAWLLTRDLRTCTASGCGTLELFRTDDGGRRWGSLGNPKAGAANCRLGHLGGPLFASPMRGWLSLNLGAGGAMGDTGGLLATDDGGRTWRCIEMPHTGALSAADPLHAWAATFDANRDAALYATDDGGGTWRPLDLGALSGP
jgi:photosystem II stability/assembly factor-like uncharacterized protein